MLRPSSEHDCTASLLLPKITYYSLTRDAGKPPPTDEFHVRNNMVGLILSKGRASACIAFVCSQKAIQGTHTL